MTILGIVPDAFGGRGGIARYSQDLFGALCALESPVCRCLVIPRRMPDAPGSLPARLTYLTEGARGRFGFARALLRAVLGSSRLDLVLCGHVLLLPGALLVARLRRCPCVLFGHGVEIWHPGGGLRNALARRVDAFVSVSAVTGERFRAWSGVSTDRCFLLPPCFEPAGFTPGEKPMDLAARYGLAQRTVLLTLARLDASEQYKGLDEVIAQLPALTREIPDIAYLVVGDGDDRSRLEQLAAAQGVGDRVVFAGWIPEAEKTAHYRLADAFVMPGRGEGFGIVFLEAMACGIPVLASAVDGSREAVRDGLLGEVVDPGDPAALQEALRRVLRQPRGIVKPGLAYFSAAAFRERLAAMLPALLEAR